MPYILYVIDYQIESQILECKMFYCYLHFILIHAAYLFALIDSILNQAITAFHILYSELLVVFLISHFKLY